MSYSERNSTYKSKQLGAAMVEVAIGFPVLMMLIMFLADAGLYLFQKSIVVDTTAQVTRAAVTQMGQREAEAAQFCTASPCALSPDCSTLRQIAKDKKVALATNQGLLFSEMQFNLSFSLNPLATYRLVTVSSKKEFRCITCQFFSSTPWDIKHTSVLVIERQPYIGMKCSNDLDTTWW